MRSKHSAPITRAESAHLAAVKSVPCVLCDTPAPSEAHHVKQGRHFATVALCEFCHRGPKGIHGDQTMLRIKKWDEVDAINETLRRVALLDRSGLPVWVAA